MFSVGSQGLFDGEALPAGAVARVGRQVGHRLHSQQMMQNARIADVQLGGLDQALAYVFEPRLQQSNHEGAGQQVAVAGCGSGGRPHGAREFGGVPRLPVHMSQHSPEPAERDRWHAGAQTRDVPLEERVGERTHPACPSASGARQVGAGEAAAHPELVQLLRSDLGEPEAAYVHELNPSSQRLGNAANQVPGRAPRQKVDGLSVRCVAQRPQQLEQRGHPLDLVDHHQAFVGAKGARRRRRQRLPVGGRLQVEERGRTRPRRRRLAGQRGLSALTCSEKRDDRDFFQTPQRSGKETLARDQPRRAPTRVPIVFQALPHCFKRSIHWSWS